MDIDLDVLERLAKTAHLPWRIYKECQLDDQHEEIRDANRFYVKNLNGERDKYLLAACNAVPELIAENRALRERVRELEIREVDYIEERDALLSTKYALERQRAWLAERFSGEKDGAPASKYFLQLAEQAAKEAGEC